MSRDNLAAEMAAAAAATAAEDDEQSNSIKSGSSSLSETWPSDSALFQPFDVEQTLLSDQANCLAAQAFLHMCQLPFRVEMRTNAEHMSPTGKLPFLKAGKFVVAEMDNIITFVNSKGASLTDHLDASQKADMKAFMSLVSHVLGNAEAYISWLDEVTLNEVTKPRYGSVYPWPLNHVLTWQKKNEVTQRLAANGFAQKSLEEVYSEVEKCCRALSERLGNQPYYFNNKPTELDALVFGHLFCILTTRMPDQRMESIVRQFKNLVELCQTVDKEYFFDRTAPSPSSRSSDNNFEKVF